MGSEGGGDHDIVQEEKGGTYVPEPSTHGIGGTDGKVSIID